MEGDASREGPHREPGGPGELHEQDEVEAERCRAVGSVTLHLPVVLWFAVAYPYMGGTIRSHERRMDFVRFTGEWVIYYVLIALGGGVLVLLTALILEPIGATSPSGSSSGCCRRARPVP